MEEKVRVEGQFSERTEGKVSCVQTAEKELECEINTDKMQGRFKIKLE